MGQMGQMGQIGQIRGPVDCARALCMALDYTFGSGRRGRYRGGFFLAPGSPGPAVWLFGPGPPGPNKKLFWICRRFSLFLIL